MTFSVVVVFACFISFASAAAAGKVDLAIDAYDAFSLLYVDGVQIQSDDLPNAWFRKSVDVVSIPSTAKVVAVGGDCEFGQGCGILASVAGDLLLTNESWKCVNIENIPASDTPQLDWFMPDYDDSHWPAAVPSDDHGEMPPISQNAKWIWSAEMSYQVYCRGRMANQPEAATSCKPVDPSDRADCGYYGITPGECVDRGCCFDDSDPNAIWCYVDSDRNPCKSSPCKNGGKCVPYNPQDFDCYCTEEFTGTTCELGTASSCRNVAGDEREECGFQGITAEDCLTNTDCCFDNSIPLVPWCFKKPKYEAPIAAAPTEPTEHAEPTEPVEDVLECKECENTDVTCDEGGENCICDSNGTPCITVCTLKCQHGGTCIPFRLSQFCSCPGPYDGELCEQQLA